MKLDLRIGNQNGRPATRAEKEAGYNYLKNFAKQEIANASPEDIKNNKPVNRKVTTYEGMTNLRLNGVAEVKLYAQKFKSTLTQDVPKAFPKLSSLPDNAKIVVTDMMFNMGATRFTKEKWKNFYEAVNQHNWSTAAKESHRSSGDRGRNDWTFKMLKDIKER